MDKNNHVQKALAVVEMTPPVNCHLLLRCSLGCDKSYRGTWHTALIPATGISAVPPQPGLHSDAVSEREKGGGEGREGKKRKAGRQADRQTSPLTDRPNNPQGEA